MITSACRPLDGFEGETRVAIHAVADAMRLARSLEGRAHASIKSDMSPVTVADLALQAVVAERLAGGRRGVPLIGEEGATMFETDAELTAPGVDAVRQIIPDATVERVAGWIGNGGQTPGARFLGDRSDRRDKGMHSEPPISSRPDRLELSCRLGEPRPLGS